MVVITFVTLIFPPQVETQFNKQPRGVIFKHHSTARYAVTNSTEKQASTNLFPQAHCVSLGEIKNKYVFWATNSMSNQREFA